MLLSEPAERVGVSHKRKFSMSEFQKEKICWGALFTLGEGGGLFGSIAPNFPYFWFSENKWLNYQPSRRIGPPTQGLQINHQKLYMISCNMCKKKNCETFN